MALNNAPSPEDLPPRMRLGAALLEVHRATALATYQQLGLTIDEWDPQAVGDFTPASYEAWLKLIVGEVDFDPDADPKPVHPGPILGFPFFSLESSAMPVDYAERVIETDPDAHSYSQRDVLDVESPVKCLVVILKGAPDDSDSDQRGLVFVAPEMPPMAVHEQDAEYAWQIVKDSRPSFFNERCLSIVSDVQACFGDEAAELLSDSSCEALIHALQTSSARTAIMPPTD